MLVRMINYMAMLILTDFLMSFLSAWWRDLCGHNFLVLESLVGKAKASCLLRDSSSSLVISIRGGCEEREALRD